MRIAQVTVFNPFLQHSWINLVVNAGDEIYLVLGLLAIQVNGDQDILTFVLGVLDHSQRIRRGD